MNRHFLTKTVWFSGSGGAYVIALLGLVAAASYLITGGLLPELDRNPVDAQHVQIDDTTAFSDKNNLQLVNIGIKESITPGQESPTPTEEPTITVGPGTPTPTPKPTRTPTPTPRTPTPTSIVACLNRTVITMMIDLSASMDNSGKIDSLNNAMTDFVNNLQSTNAIVGGIAFGGLSGEYSLDGYQGVKLLSDYTSNKTNIRNRFTDLEAGPTGGTYMRNGYKDAITRLKDFQAGHTNQNYRYVSIIFSDGVPEVLDDNLSGGISGGCLGGEKVDGVCFARQQDPRATPYGLNSTDYINQMDRLVSKSYAVAIYDSRAGERGAGLTGDLKTLLQTAASSASRPYYQGADLKNGPIDQGEFNNFFDSILNDSCS